MTELVDARASAAAANTTQSQATIARERVAGGGRTGVNFLRQLAALNLSLVALQALSAGLFLSGYSRALTAHAVAAIALQLGAVMQAIASIVLWRRRRVPGWAVSHSIGLLAAVFLQVGLGYNKHYSLHVPVGVGLFGWLMHEVERLRAPWNATEPAGGAR